MSRAISPELVLVDPDLARHERARLVEHAAVTSFTVDSLPVAAGQTRPRAPYARMLLTGAVILSLTANAALAVLVVAPRGDDTPAATAAPPVGGVDATAPAVRTAPTAPRASAGVDGEVERRVQRWLARVPDASLPPAARPRGQALRVACRGLSAPQSYSCRVWAGTRPLAQSLAVKYPAPAEGGALVTWAK